MSRLRRALTEYAMRVVLVGLLAVSFALLLRESPPFTRLRPDLPQYGDVRMLALLAVSVALAIVPLVLPRRAAFVTAAAVSALVVGVSVYPYSRIDWANIPSGGNYATGGVPPAWLVLLAAAPFVLLILYHVTRVPVFLAHDARERGAPDEDVRALRRGTRAHAALAVGVTLALWLGVGAAILALTAHRDAVLGALGAWPRVTLLVGLVLLAFAFAPLRAKGASPESGDGSAA